MRLHIVEFQDWNTPPPSDDDDDGDLHGGDGSDSDGGHNNNNGYWPGLAGAGGGGTRPRTTRFGGPSDPTLGRGSGPGFLPRQHGSGILVGQLLCPVASTCPINNCPPSSGRNSGQAESRSSPIDSVDICRSPSPVISTSADPMWSEACLIVPKAAPPPVAVAQSVDRDPRRFCCSGTAPSGTAAWSPEEDFMSLLGRKLSFESAPDGPAFLYKSSIVNVAAQENTMLLTELNIGGHLEAPSKRQLSPTNSRPTFNVTEDNSSRAPETTSSCPLSTHVGNFVDSLRVPLQAPVLSSTPPRRITKAADKADDDGWIPKRSARLAAKSKFRAAKPEAQARHVMMKKLGLEVQTEVPDEPSFDEFHAALKFPLNSSTKEAMQVLFHGRKQLALGAVSAA